MTIETENERRPTSCPARHTQLQARAGDDGRAASSRPGAARAFVGPDAAVCHVLRRAVTVTCKCLEQAVSAEVEANMKDPST